MNTFIRRYIDLHVHSNFSDGAFSPAQLVDQALSEGLETIAIADHDSVAGVAEAIAAGERLGIEVIPAVELSTQFETWQDVHVLGYGMEYTDQGFLEKLNRFRERREQRNSEIVGRVNELLARENREEIGLDEVLVYAKDAIGRPHIARALLERGYVNNVEEAFRRYLITCNIPKYYWPVGEAIAEIRRLNGVVVLAHPTSISSDRQELRRIISAMVDMGLDGIEVFNNLAQLDEMDFLRRLAAESGLLISGGSDFHGIEDHLEMGKGRGGTRFNADLLAPFRELLLKRRDQPLSL